MSKLKIVLAVLVIFSFSSARILAQDNKPKKPVAPVAEEAPDSLEESEEIGLPEINIPDIHIPDIKIDMKNFHGLRMNQKEEKEQLKKMNAELRKQMEEIKKLNKDRYFNLLRDFSFRNLDFPIFGKRDKESRERSQKISELDIQTEALGLKFQNSSKAEQDKIRGELKNKLDELFELRETNRKEEVKELEDRLTDLKKTLEERRQNKDEIVKKRMLELLGESRNIEW